MNYETVITLMLVSFLLVSLVSIVAEWLRGWLAARRILPPPSPSCERTVYRWEDTQ